jgi:hypothetical protein
MTSLHGTYSFPIYGDLIEPGQACRVTSEFGRIHITIINRRGSSFCEAGPALLVKHKVMNEGSVHYFSRLGLHREDGPAITNYDLESGKMTGKHYWFSGHLVNVDTLDEFLDYVAFRVVESVIES